MVRGAQQERVLPVYDASAFVGLWAIVYNAAIEWQEDDGEVSIELPKLPELLAAATISRCLMPAKLRGAEIKAIRRIMNLTLVDLAEALDGRPETISRWESEAQPMGAYAEKVLRLLACEELKDDAPGISYDARRIAHLSLSKGQPPAVELQLVHLKQDSGAVVEVWNAKLAA